LSPAEGVGVGIEQISAVDGARTEAGAGIESEAEGAKREARSTVDGGMLKR
jgi:hypothetical protein